jgi:membrane protein implicated in regulation of membrane protease activity
MYLIAIAWMYVVLMMAVAEGMSPVGSWLGAFFTLLLYGVAPLSIVLYILGTRLRRQRKAAQEARISELASPSSEPLPRATDAQPPQA